MQTVSISNIKKELQEKSLSELVEYCLRIAKFKKENKELLNYLLFESFDEQNYIEELKNEVEKQFLEINLSSVYFAKKSIRRILRFASKHIKYSGLKQTEIELLIHFCHQLRKLPLPYHESKVLINLYNRQLLNIQKALNGINEDLRFDYQSDLDEINKPLSKLMY